MEEEKEYSKYDAFLMSTILNNFSGIVAGYSSDLSDEKSIEYILVSKTEIEGFVTFMKLNSSAGYFTLSDLTSIDHLNHSLRFTLIYVFESFYNNCPAKIVIKTNEVGALLSIEKLFPAANWSEREVWDMFGVWFIKNKNMTRLLSDYGFIGHPLKKDFPVTGFFELYFEEQSKYLEYSSVELAQGMRIINLNSNTWNA